MRLVTRWLISLVFFLPAVARAQTPTREALVGTWVRTASWTDSTGKARVETDTLVLHADSTWELYTINAKGMDGFEPSGCAGWFLSGDSFWFGPPAAPGNIHGRTVVIGYMPIKVSLRDEELTMDVPNPRDKSPKVYKRIGDPRPRIYRRGNLVSVFRSSKKALPLCPVCPAKTPYPPAVSVEMGAAVVGAAAIVVS